MSHKNSQYNVYTFGHYEFHYRNDRIKNNGGIEHNKKYRVLMKSFRFGLIELFITKGDNRIITDILHIFIGLLVAASQHDYIYVLENISDVRKELHRKQKCHQHLIYSQRTQVENFKYYTCKYSNFYAAFDILDDLETHIQMQLLRKRTFTAQIAKATSRIYKNVKKIFTNTPLPLVKRTKA